jgi:CRP/FNR family transcriptional regulator, cyclic AMP receptor protein
MHVIGSSGSGDGCKPISPPALDLQSEFSELGVVRSYAPGAELLEQGTPAEEIYLIHEGIVKLVWTEPRGKQTILGLRWNGYPLGVFSAITGDASPISAVTLVRSLLQRISVQEFLARLRRSADLGWKMHQIHCRELSDHLNLLGELACCSARSRLARIFQRLIVAGQGEIEGKKTRVPMPLKQRELAELIGVTPEHLNRILRVLSKQGLLYVRNGWIVVPDPRVLDTL